MSIQWLRHGFTTFALLALALIAWMAPAGAADDELAALMAQSDAAYTTGRYSEAVPIAERIIALSRERYGEADPRYAAALNGLATYLQLTGNLDRAEELLRRSLAITLAALGPDHPDVATRQGNLALVLLDQDNLAEAADLLHRALANLERQAVKPEGYGSTLSNFASALERLNRTQDAERLYLTAIAAYKAQPARNEARLAVPLGNLGILYKRQRRFIEASPLLEQAVSLLEGLSKPDAPHPRLSIALNNLATLREDTGAHAEAEQLYRRALDLDQKMFGPDSPRLATRLTNLAGMYITQARHDEAATALKEALRIERAAHGDDNPRVAHPLLTGARLMVAKKEWEAAYTLISRAADIMIPADARRDTMHGRVAASRDTAGVSMSQIVYQTFLQIAGEWPWYDNSKFFSLGSTEFEIAQRLVTPLASAAIERMAERYTAGRPALAAQVRRQQALRDEWNHLETRIIAQLANPPDRIDRDKINSDRRRQAEIEPLLETVAVEIERDALNFVAFNAAKILSITRVRELLADDEALVYFADDGVHIHSFFVTKQKFWWMPLALTSKTIAEHVEALRCGLDATSWLDERADRCVRLLGINYGDDEMQSGAALPFDLARAHLLYEALFGTLGSLVAGKRLIVVPTGALATLPPHVLVTEPPDAAVPREERYQKAAWLARRQAITVLPSVASLEALRVEVPKGRAPNPFLGVGNPLLDGPRDPALSAADRTGIAAMAKQARAYSRCVPNAPATEVKVASVSRGAYRAASSGVRSVRELFALPDTADELCAIATALAVPAEDVLLGARATRDAILERSGDGSLESFAVVHFATHGLVAGEVQGLGEPALALTPAEGGDGGMLTASDIAGLRLNADWVVLSACNTAAAGSADDKEALAGLARAFFLAGTRALMVSHWPVYSQAAVALTTKAYGELRGSPGLGRAEALRRAMVALIDEGGVKARPAYWAPFVVVGDGG